MLVCSADGSPAPSLLWTHNGTVVDAATSDRTTIADEVMGTNTTSTLRVGNTTSTDSGVYMCIAESPPFPDVNSSTALVLIQGQLYTHVYVSGTLDAVLSLPHRYSRAASESHCLQHHFS